MPFDTMQRQVLVPIKNALIKRATLNGDVVEHRLLLDPSQFLPLFFLQMEYLYSRIWDDGTGASFKAEADSLFGFSINDEGDIPRSLRALLFYHSLRPFITEQNLDLDGLIHQWSPTFDTLLNSVASSQSVLVCDVLTGSGSLIDLKSNLAPPMMRASL